MRDEIRDGVRRTIACERLCALITRPIVYLKRCQLLFRAILVWRARRRVSRQRPSNPAYGAINIERRSRKCTASVSSREDTTKTRGCLHSLCLEGAVAGVERWEEVHQSYPKVMSEIEIRMLGLGLPRPGPAPKLLAAQTTSTARQSLGTVPYGQMYLNPSLAHTVTMYIHR